MRIPLYLVWSGRFAHPAVIRARELLGDADTTSVPVRADATGVITERNDAPGYRAIATVLHCTGRPMPREQVPPFTADQPYYPATLHLLAAIATAEAAGHCAG